MSVKYDAECDGVEITKRFKAWPVGNVFIPAEAYAALFGEEALQKLKGDDHEE